MHGSIVLQIYLEHHVTLSGVGCTLFVCSCNHVFGLIKDACVQYMQSHQPETVWVATDTASVFGAANAAKECGIPLVHIESGYRMHNDKGEQIPTELPEDAYRRIPPHAIINA